MADTPPVYHGGTADPGGALESVLPPDADEPDPRYRAALAWIWSFSAHPPLDAGADARRRATKLERMRTLLAALGDPQRAYPSLLVAGTKGKGSTVAMAAAMLGSSGRRIGRYTSPHLVNWRERTWVAGRWITAEEVLRLLPRLEAAVALVPPERLGQPTTFEVGTALTFAFFAEQGVDAAVVEVGVGGELDATNTLDPPVSAITPISYDHVATLGSSLARIATHKAGILRPGRVGVLAPQPVEALAAIEEVARQRGARVVQVGRDYRWRRVAGAEPGDVTITGAMHTGERRLSVRVPLRGAHQVENGTTAIAAADALCDALGWPLVGERDLREAFHRLAWPGRLDVLRSEPLVVADGAHNRASAEALARALRAEFRFKRLHLVLGITEGKDVGGIVEPLLPLASRVTVARAHHERSLDPDVLLRAVRARAGGTALTLDRCADVAAALEEAVRAARPGDLVLATGSLFVVGEALTWSRSHPSPPAGAGGG